MTVFGSAAAASAAAQNSAGVRWVPAAVWLSSAGGMPMVTISWHSFTTSVPNSAAPPCPRLNST